MHHTVEMMMVMAMQEEEEEELRQLRSRATELLLREDWRGYIRLYTNFISLSLHHLSDRPEATNGGGTKIKLRKTLCGALSNRAEAQLRLGDLWGALDDCDRALDLNTCHLKALVCKGKALLSLNRYAGASDCFRRAVAIIGSGASGSSEARDLLDRCRKLEVQSRTGALDLSQWVFKSSTTVGGGTPPPELAEYVGPVEIRRSEECGGGRGLFVTRDVEAGTTLVVTRAMVVGRGILSPAAPETAGRLVVWKDLVERLLDAAGRCRRTLRLIYSLSTGEDEAALSVPDIRLFLPPNNYTNASEEEEEDDDDEMLSLDTRRILQILDVNCLTEDAASAKVLRGGGCHGVGLWVLPSFVNHSCNPNARRLHVGDHLLIHTSRDVKAGEEVTFPYLDVLVPLSKRREAMAGTWGFVCRCHRCRLEEAVEVREMEERVLAAALDAGAGGGEDVVVSVTELEERMARRWTTTTAEGKLAKGFLRASFWEAYSATYASERLMRKWERRGGGVPVLDEVTAGESVAAAVGGDERVLKMVVEGLNKKEKRRMVRKNRGGWGTVGGDEVDVVVVGSRITKMARGVYGKVLVRKKQQQESAMRALLRPP